MSKLFVRAVLVTKLALLMGAFAATFAQTTVTVWSWRVEDVDAYEAMFDVFEEQNPDITVEFVPTRDTEYETRLSTALRANRGPDIAQLKPYGELQPLIEGGYLMPLEDRIPELDNFYPTALDGARSRTDGALYGVPYSYVNMGVFYNKTMFEENDIGIPETYDDFLAAAQTLKDAGVIPISAGGANGTGWALEINLGVVGPNAYGGDEFWQEIQSGEATFTDPRMIKAIQRLVDMAPYYSPGFKGLDYTTAIQQFINGQSAMFFGGSWENGTIKNQNPELEYGIFPFPPDVAGDTNWVSSFADGSYGLISQSDAMDEATRVLRFMASTEFAQMFADMLGWPPAQPGISPQDPVLKTMLDMQANPTPYLTLVGFRWDTPTASSVVQSEIVAVMAGDQSAEELAQHIQDAVSTWFTPGQ